MDGLVTLRFYFIFYSFNSYWEKLLHLKNLSFYS